MFVSPAFAQAGTGAAGPGALEAFLPLILIFGIFYFLLFMPMQRQKKAQQKMLTELQNGVTVITSGGAKRTTVPWVSLHRIPACCRASQ